MKDPRNERLARLLVEYSVELKEGEKILIEGSESSLPLLQEIVRRVYRVGGIPFVSLSNASLQREILKSASREQMQDMARWDLARMKEMQAFIGIRAGNNINELSDVPDEKLNLYMAHYSKPVHLEQRVPHTRWCVLRYPTASMAQLANSSIEGFEDFYFDVCTLDYAKMSRAMDPLVELLERTDRVRIAGPGTDLEFSIRGLSALKADGKANIPDGEVFTAPVRESVQGVISYNTPSVNQGFTYDSVVLEFKEGKIVKARANDSERINRLLDTDEGARYIGEFALGVNPYILAPMKDTLFDEKIAGSIHFTPGNAYDDCDNGNRSALHWDLVCIQRPEYGGGEIYFDGRLVRKDGLFVLPELEGLNPENLK